MEEQEERVGEALPDGEERVGVEVPADGTEAVLEADGGEDAATDDADEEEVRKSDDGETSSDALRLPWGINLNDSVWYFTRLPNGSRIVQFVPIQRMPEGTFPMPPAVSIGFSREGWESFQRDIANDGVKPKVQAAKPSIVKATQMPREPRDHPRTGGRRRR